MKIIVLGAGQVGASVAHSLSNEENDITVVDTDASRLKVLQERLDIRAVVGHASHPKALVRAGVEDADLILAPHSGGVTSESQSKAFLFFAKKLQRACQAIETES